MTASELKYLLAVYRGEQEGGIRQTDIADRLAVARASVARGTECLRAKGLVCGSEKPLTLSAEGRRLAALYDTCARKLRQCVLEQWDVRLSEGQSVAMAAELSDAQAQKFARTDKGEC